MPLVFLSYRHESDRGTRVRSLAGGLENAGLQVIFDEFA
jgi:hypothetical protein